MSSSASLLLVLLAATGLSRAQTPAPVSTVLVTPVPSPTPPSCPGSDGTTYNGPSGSQFVIECGIDHAGGDLSNTRVDTFEECILACDAEPNCVDVSLSGVACYLKDKLGAALFQKDILGARRLSPTSSTTANPSATPAPPSCPSSNSTIFIANSYARFQIGCGYETAGGDMGRVFVVNLEECVQTCDTTEGSCYLKSELGSISPSTGVSYARLTAEKPQCPSPANRTYTASNGKQFVIECDKDYPGGDIDSAVLVSADGTGESWFGQCIERCAANPECVDISLSGAGCYLKGGQLGPASNATGIFGARWIDAPVITPTPTPSPSPIPSAISPVDVGNFEYLACYNDSVGARALRGDFLYGTDEDPMTAQVCAEFCDDSNYFGLEYGQLLILSYSVFDLPDVDWLAGQRNELDWVEQHDE
ncbi:hypothetical protein PRZ48_013491 [Zasmidium cellare]|uniref:Apple domain-containing protein n=1 Tax=Zasmidium cellare TaxID=395010 RepID=A0ABR0E1H1_ZASCE|nr:hypothetical protein PRZ48_013491 [Zasmidium cellare]